MKGCFFITSLFGDLGCAYRTPQRAVIVADLFLKVRDSPLASPFIMCEWGPRIRHSPLAKPEPILTSRFTVNLRDKSRVSALLPIY